MAKAEDSTTVMSVKLAQVVNDNLEVQRQIEEAWKQQVFARQAGRE
tara:strand:+ start:405 stop:542 length:138 start_codon:yes stop_codon:yes gene_type:complete